LLKIKLTVLSRKTVVDDDDAAANPKKPFSRRRTTGFAKKWEIPPRHTKKENNS